MRKHLGHVACWFGWHDITWQCSEHKSSCAPFYWNEGQCQYCRTWKFK